MRSWVCLTSGMSSTPVCYTAQTMWERLWLLVGHNLCGHSLSSSSSSTQTPAIRKPELVLYCQPGQILITRHINIAIVRALCDQMVGHVVHIVLTLHMRLEASNTSMWRFTCHSVGIAAHRQQKVCLYLSVPWVSTDKTVKSEETVN